MILVSLNTFSLDNFKVIETPEFVDQAEYELGRHLFHEKLLSRDNAISCSTCHKVNNFGVDNLKTSKGANGFQTKINTPSIYNMKYHKVFFIDGREDSLRGAIRSEIENKQRFNSSWVEVISKLRQVPYYNERFVSVYNSKVEKKLIIDALTAYLNQLVLPASKFDDFIEKKVELTTTESRGYKKFKRFGCFYCHSGALLGGTLFSSKGSFFKKKEQEIVKTEKYGRYNITKNEDDLFHYKVPSLRNVEFTSPYFYFGEIRTLEEAIEKKVFFQLGERPSDQDINDLKSFLKTLSSPNIGEKYGK